MTRHLLNALKVILIAAVLAAGVYLTLRLDPSPSSYDYGTARKEARQ